MLYSLLARSCSLPKAGPSYIRQSQNEDDRMLSEPTSPPEELEVSGAREAGGDHDEDEGGGR